MFRKVIAFGLFEMIRKKKKRVRIASPGSGSAYGSGRVEYGGVGRHNDFSWSLH